MRVAAARLFHDEAYDRLGVAFSSLCFDIDAFYDSVDAAGVLRACISAGFPVPVIVLSALNWTAPRILQERGHSSEPIQPFRSIVAGEFDANDAAREYIAPLLQRIHEGYRPKSLSLHAWVDDIVESKIGPASSVVDDSVDAAVDLADGLDDLGLKLSPKSKLLASSRDIGKASAAKLDAAHVTITLAAVADDLGLERGHHPGHHLKRAAGI